MSSELLPPKLRDLGFKLSPMEEHREYLESACSKCECLPDASYILNWPDEPGGPGFIDGIITVQSGQGVEEGYEYKGIRFTRLVGSTPCKSHIDKQHEFWIWEVISDNP